MVTRTKALARIRVSPWLFGGAADLWVFGGSALLALALSAWAAANGIGALPSWAWLLLVVGIDVAHVHATWFRTYFDPKELARRPLRYVLIPTLAYAGCVIAYRAGPWLFWRLLSYLAVFHFIRQQVGWVALYRARDTRSFRYERVLDEATIYAATLYPLLEWHAHLQSKAFSWFVPSDFVAIDAGRWLPAARVLWCVVLVTFFLRQAVRVAVERRLSLGKILVVATTVSTWYFGIVQNQSDFVFTASNVIPHGVPYAWLLFVYARERSRLLPSWSLGQFAGAGFLTFAAVLVALGAFEQWAWDRLVDHDRPWLFGDGWQLSNALLAWVVPLLALPQVTHYVLDGLLWRRGETKALPALRAALGLPVIASSGGGR